jgi:zinc transporter ZupT
VTFDKVIAFLNAERLSAALVYIVGSIVGAYAARGFTPLQWGGAALAVIGSILVAVIIRTWPEKAKLAVGETREG